MDQQNTDVKRIDEFISSLDKVAAKKRKATYLIVVPIFLVVMVVSLILFPNSSPDSMPVGERELEKPIISPFSELNFSQVRDHFQMNKEALQVEVPEMKKVVSLHSEKEYWELLEELSVLFLDDEGKATEEKVEEVSPDPVVHLVTTQKRKRPQANNSRKKNSTASPSGQRKRKKTETRNKQAIQPVSSSPSKAVEEPTSSTESVAALSAPSLDPEAEVFEVKKLEVKDEKSTSPTTRRVSEAGESTTLTTSESSSNRNASSLRQPLVVASKNPSFPGGELDLASFLNSKIKYPQPARDYHVEGTVYVQFVIQSDGRTTNHKVLKGIGYGCDEEALRIAQSMPRWAPGEQNGEAVPVWFTLPVKFDLLN